MTVDIIRDVFAWSSAINIGILLFWWLWFMLAHDFVYRFHGNGSSYQKKSLMLFITH